MKKIWLLLAGLLSLSCTDGGNGLRERFPDIIDVSQTPIRKQRKTGCFTDAGSWMGFTVPARDRWVNGFCGPFSLDARKWFAVSAAEVTFAADTQAFVPQEARMYPGEAVLTATSPAGTLRQRLIFADPHTALLQIRSDTRKALQIRGRDWKEKVTLAVTGNTVRAQNGRGEIVLLTFPGDLHPVLDGDSYSVSVPATRGPLYVALSFLWDEKKTETQIAAAESLLQKPEAARKANAERWNGYLRSVLRDDMKPEYDRIAVKALVTLVSNWRKERGAILHEGITPSHAVDYFGGFWAWDSWRFSASLADILPELARNNIRAMFDYQQEDGMIIDCYYPTPGWENERNSKPPIAAWAVNEIFLHQKDTAFVREMYPKLLAYYRWWYEKRDHDGNGMCEFGSTDGTLEAAAWESGMDNAIRFDHTKMVRNGKDAYSMDQENVDLNSFLALEARLLKKFSALTGLPFDAPDYSDAVADYFFDPKQGYFFDRRLGDGSFVGEPACEGYNPFWTGIASKAQMEQALKLFTDEKKFSTYIPFPTAAADNPHTSEDGYWRGPIWLDQTYFAIRGLRNYGYTDLADRYTEQVFDRLEGLTGNAPIHENYGTHDGRRLQAPFFSWSSSHLLMLYKEYKKNPGILR